MLLRGEILLSRPDPNFRWDKALEAAAALEDEELSRKFSLRKMIVVDVNLCDFWNRDHWATLDRSPCISAVDYENGLRDSRCVAAAAFGDCALTYGTPPANYAGFDFAVGYWGNLTADAHLAALAIERALSFAQRTNDFGRFNRVRSRNPLSG
jgi:hypothetical protein